jgi:hypothetical protein
MTGGAMAMVVATEYPQATKLKRASSSVAEDQFPMVTSGKLSMARAVIAYAPESRRGQGRQQTARP